MTTIEDTPEEAAFRSQVRTALAARLRPKPPGAAFSVMGAGQDNLDEGRRYLAVLADGGYAVPTWPVEHGGMAATPDQAAIIAR